MQKAVAEKRNKSKPVLPQASNNKKNDTKAKFKKLLHKSECTQLFFYVKSIERSNTFEIAF